VIRWGIAPGITFRPIGKNKASLYIHCFAFIWLEKNFERALLPLGSLMEAYHLV